MALDITSIPASMRANKWGVGAALMEDWFARKPAIAPKYGAPDTTSITMKWVLGFSRAKSVFDQLVKERIWVNAAAQGVMTSYLPRKGALIPASRRFGRLDLGPQHQHYDSLNFRAVGFGWDDLDDMSAALGNFAFHVLPAGYVTAGTGAIGSKSSLKRSPSTSATPTTSTGRGNLVRPSTGAGKELVAMVTYYEQHVPQWRRDKLIDVQVRTFTHNLEHYQKITANLLPVLSMLTSGDLGRTLSPETFDASDLRPIMNFEKIERAGHVLYMCLDSLPDPSVANAIGALALADLAARAGMGYNLGGYCRIALFVDEVSNVINQHMIEILNKGAEGGNYTTCAMQTLADMARRLGSEHAPRMALGNLNNLIAMRSKDRPTQEFVVEASGRTAIHSLRVGFSSGSDTHLGDFSASRSSQLSESVEEMVPADVLGKLPNLQYFASVSGGRIIKGRFPILEPKPHGPTP